MPRYILHFDGSEGNKRIAYLLAIHNLKTTIGSNPGQYQIQENPDGSIAFTTPNNAQPSDRDNISFIDLKPYFATGAHVRQNKSKPGWHTIVPIQPTRDKLLSVLRPSDQQSLENLAPGQTIKLKDLAQLTGEFKNNITGGVNYQNGYTRAATMFRTISNNSPANSWITSIKRDSNGIKNITIDANALSPEEIQNSQVVIQNTPQAKANITNQIKKDLNKKSFNLGNNTRSLPQSYQENLFNPDNVQFNNINDINR